MKLFDLHCDTIYECCETGKHLRENDLHINYAAARRYQPYVQFFALFCGARQPYSPETRDCLLDTLADERFDRMLTTARREFAANADWLTFCRSAADIRAAVEAGKAAALLSIEGAELLPDRPDALDYVYDAGVRLITLTWNYRSRYGCSSAVDQNEGLTELGKQLVRDCGEKGIIVDVRGNRPSVCCDAQRFAGSVPQLAQPDRRAVRRDCKPQGTGRRQPVHAVPRAAERFGDR